MIFPKVSGHNLDRELLTFPDEFAGQYNIILIAFQQWQQTTVNTWLPFVRDQISVQEGLTYYEFPVIQSMNMISRWFINEGMRAGIPDPVARQKTITLYLNKSKFRAALDIQTEQDITILLVDSDGQVLARSQGQYSPEKGEALLRPVREPALALH